METHRENKGLRHVESGPSYDLESEYSFRFRFYDYPLPASLPFPGSSHGAII